jgi:hypothetical protein
MSQVDLWKSLADELDRQDQHHRDGFPATRDGLRLALAAIEDETMEAKDAHRAERRIDGWSETRAELIQIAVVAIRALRSIDEVEGGR